MLSSVLFRYLVIFTLHNTRGRFQFPNSHRAGCITVFLNPFMASVLNPKQVRASARIITRVKGVAQRTLTFTNRLLTGYLLGTKNNNASHFSEFFHGDVTHQSRLFWGRITALLRQPVGVTRKQKRNRSPEEKPSNNRRRLTFHLITLEEYPPSKQ